MLSRDGTLESTLRRVAPIRKFLNVYYFERGIGHSGSIIWLTRNNTVISNLGKYELSTINIKSKRTTIDEVLNKLLDILFCKDLSKQVFVEMHNNRLNKLIGCGSITDGVHKLEMHIINFSYNNYCKLELTKSNKIEVIGYMKTEECPAKIVSTLVSE
ncbi:hypothetical protein ACFW04_013586 [Cataglyphis niger]